ncbi:MAG: hypothetical protein K5770_07995 [Lachnospiraceae bacterium]|nr:hypothetical protein [Lachnospiraceae bacterium]
MIKRSMVITCFVLIFTAVSLIFSLTLRPWHVLSVFFLVLSILLCRLTFIDVDIDNGNDFLARATYLPAVLWFILFEYFDLFIIGFGPARSFKSVIISVFLCLVMIPVYAVMTVAVLDRIYEHEDFFGSKTLPVGFLASLVSIIIVWYFSLSAFHSVEEWIGLSSDLCIKEYGLFGRIWDLLGFI